MKNFRAVLDTEKPTLNANQKALTEAQKKAYEMYNIFSKCKPNDFDPFDKKFVDNVNAACDFYSPLREVYLINVVGARLAKELKPVRKLYENSDSESSDENSKEDAKVNWDAVNRILALHNDFLLQLHEIVLDESSSFSDEAWEIIEDLTLRRIPEGDRFKKIDFSNTALILYNLDLDPQGKYSLRKICPPNTLEKTQLFELVTSDKFIKALQRLFNANTDADYNLFTEEYNQYTQNALTVLHPNFLIAVEAGMDPVSYSEDKKGNDVTEFRSVSESPFLTHGKAIELYESGVSFETVENALKDAEDPLQALGAIAKGDGKEKPAETEPNETTKETAKDLQMFETHKAALSALKKTKVAFDEGMASDKVDDDKKASFTQVSHLMKFDHRVLQAFFNSKIAPVFDAIINTTDITSAMQSLDELKTVYETDMLNIWFKHCNDNDCLDTFKNILDTLSKGKITDDTFKKVFGFGIDQFDTIPSNVRKRVFGFDAMCLYASGAKLEDLAKFFVKRGKINSSSSEEKAFDGFASTRLLGICILTRRFQGIFNIFKNAKAKYFDMITSKAGTNLIVAELNGKDAGDETHLPFQAFGIEVSGDDTITFVDGIESQQELNSFTKQVFPFLQASGESIKHIYNIYITNEECFNFFTSNAIVAYLKSGHTIQDIDEIKATEGSYEAAKQKIVKLNSEAKQAEKKADNNDIPADVELEKVDDIEPKDEKAKCIDEDEKDEPAADKDPDTIEDNASPAHEQKPSQLNSQNNRGRGKNRKNNRGRGKGGARNRGGGRGGF